ncbi:MAG TPA: DUF5691 domain-containing protein [Micromonosporaceae bacterium]|jgi:hypothetical protein
MTEALWPQLVSTALVGTQRRAPSATTIGANVAALVPTRPLRSESDLLVAAGALALARRCGFASIDGVIAPAAAPADERPLTPAAACVRLRHLLAASVDVHLVGLWLALAVERGLRAPARDLPNLFRAGRAHEQLRADITTVAGRRGAWLAAQRSEWQWVLDGRAATIEVTDEAAWLEGTLADRVAYLTTTRRRDPDRGRELLVGVWPAEPPAERAALLSALATGLAVGDEAFCEEALVDRRAEVRAVAADLLAVLPASAYARRVAERARCHVRSDRTALVVTPPEHCDAGMKRDGIAPKPPAGIGERAWWFEQVIAVTRPDAWSTLDRPIADLVAAPVEDGWRPSLHRAWARAAIRHRDGGWAAALLAVGFGHEPGSGPADRALAGRLLALVAPDALIAAATSLVRAATAADAEVAEVLAVCPRPWPPRLAADLLTHLTTRLRASRGAYVPPQLRELATVIISGMPPSSSHRIATELAAFAASLGEVAPMFTNLIDTLVTAAVTRHQILGEFM